MYNFGLKHKYQVLIPYYWISQSNVPRLRGSIIIYENFYLSVSQGFYYRLQMFREVTSTVLWGDLVVEIINQHIEIVNHIYLSSGTLCLARLPKK